MAGPARREVVAWSVYDLANTIFSFNILSLYFPIWAKDELGALDTHLSIAFSLSMLIVAVASPIAGAISDRRGRRLPLLMLSTLTCVACTTLLGLGTLGVALLLYAVANLAFQLGLVFYDALLPAVSTPETVGAVGGAGIGLGYIGSFIGLGTGAILLATLDQPHPWIFAATGALFLLFALPCFILVREPPPAPTGPSEPSLLAKLRETWQDLQTRPALRRFLLARFVYTDAANTLIIFMGIYATREIGFTEAGAQGLLAVGIAAAVLGGFLLGRRVDHVGAKPVLNGVLGLWTVALAGAAIVPTTPLPNQAFWGVAVLAGLALGGTWASDRPLMLELTPAGRVGEYYGLYGMVGRFAAVLGPLVWALVVDGLDWGRPAAVLTLLVAIVVSAWILAGVEGRDSPTPVRAGA